MSDAIWESLPLLPPEPDRVEVDEDQKPQEPAEPATKYNPGDGRYHLRTSPNSVEE